MGLLSTIQGGDQDNGCKLAKQARLYAVQSIRIMKLMENRPFLRRFLGWFELPVQ